MPLATRLIALPLLIASLLAGCQLAPQQATYAYVGKVSTERSLLKASPDEVTVLMRFTGGEWQRDSGICFDHAETEVHGSEIRLKIFTSPCSHYSTPVAYQFPLKHPTRSEYDLVFIDPDGTRHPLGKFRP